MDEVVTLSDGEADEDAAAPDGQPAGKRQKSQQLDPVASEVLAAAKPVTQGTPACVLNSSSALATPSTCSPGSREPSPTPAAPASHSTGTATALAAPTSSPQQASSGRHSGSRPATPAVSGDVVTPAPAAPAAACAAFPGPAGMPAEPVGIAAACQSAAASFAQGIAPLPEVVTSLQSQLREKMQAVLAELAAEQPLLLPPAIGDAQPFSKAQVRKLLHLAMVSVIRLALL